MGKYMIGDISMSALHARYPPAGSSLAISWTPASAPSAVPLLPAFRPHPFWPCSSQFNIAKERDHERGSPMN